jgi:hypothetical protein
MKTRGDGSRYPCHEADDAVLSEDTDPNAQTDCGFEYQLTLADLIVDLLAGGPLSRSSDSDPECWVTLENQIIRNAALEVKALTVALEWKSVAGDTADDLTEGEKLHLMRALGRRLEAGAELAKRLRRARWGHPSFGGGENWEAKQAVKS